MTFGCAPRWANYAVDQGSAGRDTANHNGHVGLGHGAGGLQKWMGVGLGWAKGANGADSGAADSAALRLPAWRPTSRPSCSLLVFGVAERIRLPKSACAHVSDPTGHPTGSTSQQSPFWPGDLEVAALK